MNTAWLTQNWPALLAIAGAAYFFLKDNKALAGSFKLPVLTVRISEEQFEQLRQKV